MTYLRDLPRASLVVTFGSENIPTLLQGLHSLRQRTPGILVADTILVHMPSPSQTGTFFQNEKKKEGEEKYYFQTRLFWVNIFFFQILHLACTVTHI